MSTLYKYISPLIKKEKVNICIFGNYSGDNIGDNAILKMMLYDLRNETSIQKVFVPSRRPNKISRIWEHIKKPETVSVSPKESLIIILKSDIIVVGGGTIFSKYAGPFVYLLPWILILARLMGKKIAFYSIGFEKSTPKFILYPIYLAMRISHKISVRDEKSLSNLSTISRKKKIDLVEDPVKRISSYYNEDEAKKEIESIERLQNIQIENAVCTGFNYVKEEEINRNIEIVFPKIVDSIEEDKKIVMLSFYVPKDYELNLKIKSSAKTSDRIIVLENTLDPFSVLYLFKKSHHIIAERLHSMILAHASGTNFFAISYQEKCDAFLKQINHEKWSDLKDTLLEKTTFKI